MLTFLRRTKNRSLAKSAGFTLLEVMLVIALLGLIVSSAAPSIGRLFRVSVKSSVRRFGALVRFAYDQSILTGRIHRIVLDMDKQIWDIEAAEPGMLPLDKERTPLYPDAVSQEPAFKRAGKGVVGSLPAGVEILEVDSWRRTDQEGPAKKGVVSIYAYPSGFVDEASITLSEQGKGQIQRFKISIQSLTGRVKVETETGQ
jgi:prepilin-type N-terminal cleavage/methylation domain-containing protein